MLPPPNRKSPSGEDLVLDEADLVVLADALEQAPEDLAETVPSRPSSGVLPAVTAPPPTSSRAPWARELRPSPFARSSSGSAGALLVGTSPPSLSAADLPPPSLPSVPSMYSSASLDSVAPVATGRAPAPAFIVVRGRPRAAWIVGSAAVGAACAVVAMRVLAAVRPGLVPAAAVSAPAPHERATVSAAAEPAAAPPEAEMASAPAVLRFDDTQAVAVPAPADAPSPSPRAPRLAPPSPPAKRAGAPRPSLGPRLPDGSYGLGGSDSEPSRPVRPSASSLAAPAPPPGPTPARTRAPTPEQDLAEAQLKASMK